MLCTVNTSFGKFLLLLSCTLLSLCTSIPGTKAQSPHFRHLTVTTGLPSSEVYNILQDKKGYLWFATDLGVCRYDGYNFTTFTTRNGLADNCIFQLTEDGKGRIWLRSFNGGISYIQNDSVHSPPCNTAIKKWLNRGYLKSLYVDSGDTLWIGAVSSGSYLKVDPGYTEKDIHPYKLGNFNYIRQVESKGYIWGYQNSEVAIGKTQDIKVLPLNKSPFVIPDTLEAGQGRNSYCKLLSNGNFLFAVNNEIFLIGPNGLIYNRQFDKSIISVSETSDGHIWLGFFYGGVMCFRNSEALKGPPMKTYLKNRSVSWVLKDKEGATWFSTLDDGVYYLHSENIMEYDVKEGLSTSKTNTALIHKGKIWAGLDNGMIARIDPATDSIREYRLFPPGMAASSIQSINLINGKVCAGGTAGLYIFPPGNPSAFFTYRTLARASCRSNDGSVWIATVNSVVKQDANVLNETLDSIDVKQRITSVYEDSKGKLWIGTLTGLWIYENKMLSQYRPQDTRLKVKISGITESKGRLWLATTGQGVLSIEGDKLRQVSIAEGLSSDMCRSVYVDHNNNVWAATNKGVNKIVPGAALHVYNYGAKNGLCSDDVLSISGSGDTICLATSDGIVLFTSILLNKTAPPLYINKIVIGEHTAALSPNYTLPYSDNTIQLDFVALSYQWPDRISYRYRLSGLDKKWNSTTSTSIKYLSVPPGNYTLTLYAVNADGFPSRPLMLQFTVKPPFYRTWWMYLSAFCVIPVTMLIVFRRRLRKVQLKQEEKAVLNRQIAGIELKALKAQMNPHFIFNAINAIQSFIIRQDREAAQNYLSKFSRLVRNVLENSEQQFITLEKEIQTLILYLEIEKLRYGSKLEYEIIIDREVVIEEIRIPPMLIQPYVENAIRHGISALPAGGKVTIRFAVEDKRLKAIVSDNGIGRRAALEMKRGSEHTSMGMKVTSDRIRIINKAHSKERDYSVHITDLDNESGIPGTRVEVYIPL